MLAQKKGGGFKRALTTQLLTARTGEESEDARRSVAVTVWMSAVGKWYVSLVDFLTLRVTVVHVIRGELAMHSYHVLVNFNVL